jgi:hypothetical protein
MQNPNYPWETHPEEKEFDYELFSIYLDLGKHRSYKLVARIKGYSLRTIARRAALYDWYNRAKAFDAYCLEGTSDVEIDLYKSNKDHFFRTRNDINQKLTGFMYDFTEEFLNPNNTFDPNPLILKRIKFLNQVFRTLTMINKNIEFDKYPKADLPEMVSWKSKSDKGTFYKQPDTNAEEYLEKISIDTTITSAEFTAQLGLCLDEINSSALSDNTAQTGKTITELEYEDMTPEERSKKTREMFKDLIKIVKIK